VTANATDKMPSGFAPRSGTVEMVAEETLYVSPDGTHSVCLIRPVGQAEPDTSKTLAADGLVSLIDGKATIEPEHRTNHRVLCFLENQNRLCALTGQPPNVSGLIVKSNVKDRGRRH
jgi:hypothetical protein